MQTKELQEVYKNAQEVTSLGSTDRVALVDEQGKVKKISRAQAVHPQIYVNSVSTEQWIRIATFNANGCALLSINSTWYYTPGVHMLIDCILNPSDVVYNDAVLLTRLSNAPSTLFSKLRFVAKNNATCYIDVYYNVNNHNPFTIMLVAGVNVTILDTLIPNAQIPEGYSVKEFDLTSTAVRGRGGVKHYGITLYDLGKKGGRHEFGNKTLDSRHIDKCRPKSFYLPRNRKGLKRCSSRSFVLLSEYSKYPLRLGSRNNFFWRNHEISGGHRTDRRHKILTLLSSRSCNLVSLGCKIAGKEVAA